MLGTEYTIKTPGDTDWVNDFGAADNNTGTIFTASTNGLVDVNATAIVLGTEYTIKTPGDTDWVNDFGAADNNTGTIFTASTNGLVGSGTGVATTGSGTGVATTIINTSGTQSGVHQYILPINTSDPQSGVHSYSKGKIQTAVIAEGGGGYAINSIVSVVGGDGTGIITIDAVNSTDIIYGNCSGVYTGTGTNSTYYVGQKSLTAELGIAANTVYIAKVLFKSNTNLDSVQLRCGHAATDVDFHDMIPITLTPTLSAIKSSTGSTTVYGLSGEFVTLTDPYHAIWLEIKSGGNAFELLIDNLEFTNPVTGDRIIVGRAAQSTLAGTAIAYDHIQYATFNALGNFTRQRWTELLNYDWITDQQLTVDSPNMVPSLRLNEIFRYGGQIRPFKQSWIISKLNAIRTFVQKANTLLLTINLSDSQLNWRKRLGSPFVKGSSTFDTKDYWEYKDWFHPDYTISSSTVPQYTVTERNDLYDVDEDVYFIVRVDSDDADGNWAFYQWVNDQWFKIGKQNGTIQLKNTLYNVTDVDAGWDAAEWDIAGWDKNYTNELLNILIALREDVFVGPYKLYWKEMFFAILRYIYSEQTNLDWVAKTTFLQLNRKTPGELIPKTFDVGAEKDILDYLDLVKPYHSKIETIFDTRTFNEDVNASADEVVDVRVQTNFRSTVTETFTATPNQQTFTLVYAYTVGTVEAYLNGMKLVEGNSNDYVAIDTNTVVLNTNVASGNVLQTITYDDTITPTTETFTAIANQTIFTLTNSYIVGGVEVYLNGVKLIEGLAPNGDYVAVDTSSPYTAVLNTGAADGDVLQTVAYTTIPTTETFLATLNQIIFALSPETSYIDGRSPFAIEVYLNGVKLILGSDNDYTLSNNPYTVILNTPAAYEDVLQTVTFDEDPRAFRMFIDNTGTRIYETIINDDKTTVAVDIDASETSITVADASKLIILPSNTGATWTKVDLSGLGLSSATQMDWNAGAVNGATIVIAGEQGRVIISEDGGATWRVQTLYGNAPASKGQVNYGNGYFVYTDEWTATFYASDDDIIQQAAWTTSSDPALTGHLATDGNGTWISADSNNLKKSTDNGDTWATQADANYNSINSIAYGGGKWITATSGTNPAIVGISWTDDLLSWTNVDLTSYLTHHTDADPLFIKYVNNKWFIGLEYGHLLTSDDGETWSIIILDASTYADNVNGIAYGGGLYTVILSTTGWTESIRTSTDLITWTDQSQPFGAAHLFAGIVYAPTTKKFLGFGKTYTSGGSTLSGMIESSDGLSGISSGTIVIDAERIDFTGASTNTLTGCTRGIAGTAPATHTSGASVISAGALHALPVEPDPEAYNAFNDDATTPLHLSTNPQAVLINVGKGTI